MRYLNSVNGTFYLRSLPTPLASLSQVTIISSVSDRILLGCGWNPWPAFF